MGTIVMDIPDNKRVLYYSLIPVESNVPILEFLAAQHTTEAIAYLLELSHNGVKVKLQYIVTEFSYTIITCVQVFSKCTIKTYCFYVLLYVTLLSTPGQHCRVALYKLYCNCN